MCSLRACLFPYKLIMSFVCLAVSVVEMDFLHATLSSWLYLLVLTKACVTDSERGGDGRGGYH